MMSKSSLQQILGYLLIFFIMFWTYKEYIVPIYGYTGFGFNVNYNKFIFSIFSVLVVSFALPHRFKKPSDIFLHIQFIMPILPMLVIYSADDQSTLFMLVTLLAFLIIFIVSNHVRLKSIRLIRVSSNHFQKLLFTLSFLVIASIIMLGGLSYLNFDMAKVYDFRENSMNNLPSIYGYISPLASKVLLPFSMLLAVIHRQWLLVLLSFFGSIMMFGLTAHKGPLFYPFVVLGLYYISVQKNFLRYFILFFLLLLIAIYLDFYLGGQWVGNLIFRRTFMVPALLNYNYYDYFSSNSFYFWSHSKITFSLIDPVYDLPPANLIGREYFGSAESGANTGWIGSGFMNAGFLGMFIYSFIIGLVFSLLNSYSKLIDKRVIVSIFIPVSLTLMSSSDLPTAFFNHGILLAFLLFSIFTYNNSGGVK